MEIKERTPMVLEPSTNYNSSELARKIAQIFDETSISEAKKEIRRIRSLMSCYQCAIMEIETKFKVLNERFSLDYERNPIEAIKSRVKSPESIREKLKRKNLPFTLDSLDMLYDIAGVRVICSFVDDIKTLAECLLVQDDIRLVEMKDYITHPKENGYRSLHLIVEVPVFLENEKRLMKVEVQLRTIAMEFWANLEHKMRYKKDLPEEILKKTSYELFVCAETSAMLDKKMQNIKDIIEKN